MSCYLPWISNTSGGPEVFYKKDVLKNFAKMHGKAPVPESPLLKRFQASE